MPISNKNKKCKKNAEIWLKCLRRGEYPYSLYIQLLREEVSDGRFMLEDIGTSEEELAELCKKGATVAARVWLAHVKKDHGLSRCVHFLAGEIRKGGLTPTDIGITMEELTLLAPMAAAVITNQ